MPNSHAISHFTEFGTVEINFEDGSCLLQAYPNTQLWSYLKSDCHITGRHVELTEKQLDNMMTREVVMLYTTSGKKQRTSKSKTNNGKRELVERSLSPIDRENLGRLLSVCPQKKQCFITNLSYSNLSHFRT